MAKVGFLVCVVLGLAPQMLAAEPYTHPAPSPPVPVRKPGSPVPGPAYSQQPPPVYPHPARRKRLVIHLSNVPVVDLAKTLTELLDSEQKNQRPYTATHNTGGVVFVPEPVSNSLLISGESSQVDEITDLISELDVQPDMVAVDVLIAEMPPVDEETEEGESADRAPPAEEDGTAWLEWAKESKRITTLSRPRIMTLDNQPATVQVGERVPVVTRADGDETSIQTQVGLTLSLTPRISPEELIFLELDAEHSSIVECRGVPVMRKASAQTTLSAKDGQTIVLRGLIQRADDSNRQLVIVVTPRVIEDEDSEKGTGGD